jgi:hypothetical protein
MNILGRSPKVEMPDLTRFVVAVTGAQGVGKSTFCGHLLKRLHEFGRRDTTLLDGLGDRIEALGIPLGSISTPQTVAALFTAHLEREASIKSGLIMLDRCVVDALAYTRALRINSEVEMRLYEQIANLAANRLNFVIHLGLSPFFVGKGGAHETPALRLKVAENIPIILADLKLSYLDLDAAMENAAAKAATTILNRLV